MAAALAGMTPEKGPTCETFFSDEQQLAGLMTAGVSIFQLILGSRLLPSFRKSPGVGNDYFASAHSPSGGS